MRMMMGGKCWGMAVALWTLLAGIAVIALATVVANLAPWALPAGPRDTLGLVALGLLVAAHVGPLPLSRQISWPWR